MEGKRVRQVKGDEVDVGRERGCSFGLKARRSKSKLFFMNKRRAHRKRMKRKKTESERCTAWKELAKGGQTISGTPNKQGKTQYVCVRVSQLQISAGVGGRWGSKMRPICQGDFINNTSSLYGALKRTHGFFLLLSYTNTASRQDTVISTLPVVAWSPLQLSCWLVHM